MKTESKAKNQVLAYMKKKGLSKSVFARNCGVEPKTMLAWLKGEQTITLLTWSKIVDKMK